MKAKQIFKISLLIIAVLALIWVAPLARLATGGLRTPARVPAPDYWPTNGWQTSSPEEQGFDSAKLAKGIQALQEKQVGADSLTIIRNGYVLLDAHFAPYDGTFPHDLGSVTKSVMTTLIGIGGLVFNLVGIVFDLAFGLLGGLIGGAIFRTDRLAAKVG